MARTRKAASDCVSRDGRVALLVKLISELLAVKGPLTFQRSAEIRRSAATIHEFQREQTMEELADRMEAAVDELEQRARGTEQHDVADQAG